MTTSLFNWILPLVDEFDLGVNIKPQSIVLVPKLKLSSNWVFYRWSKVYYLWTGL